jgi:ABC-2 type transport system ATP-binding protein
VAPSIDIQGLWEGFRPGRRRRVPWRGTWRWALRDIDLQVDPGEKVGVIGHNGSGKTTLLQATAGVFPPTRGTVQTRGRVSSLVDLHAGFHRDLNGHENLQVAGVLLGMSRRQLRERYDEIIAFTGLEEDALQEPLSTFSSGMGLRLGFALVVCTDPSVLLVDEVLAVGDEAFQRQCVDRIEELVAGGCAALVASHDTELIAKHCDRVTVLHGGEQAFTGPTLEGIARYEELLATPAE